MADIRVSQIEDEQKRLQQIKKLAEMEADNVEGMRQIRAERIAVSNHLAFIDAKIEYINSNLEAGRELKRRLEDMESLSKIAIKEADKIQG